MYIAILQARMGSTRLPNKVMMKILSKPLISYQLERVSTSKYIDKLIIATSTNPEDDKLAEYLSELGYTVYRGDSNDVLGRYYEAFMTLPKELQNATQGIIRLTGDCPLFESEICDKLIKRFEKKELDYASTSPKITEGLDCEIFKKELLFEAFHNAKLASQREHVTLYINDNKEKFNIDRLDNDTDDSNYRITVDEPEDFQVVKNIIEYFNENKLQLHINNIKKYLDNHPDIFNLNSKIIRNEGLIKSLQNDKEIL
jgi:spore coat polysaccharide biosynthesis protein SpsF